METWRRPQTQEVLINALCPSRQRSVQKGQKLAKYIFDSAFFAIGMIVKDGVDCGKQTCANQTGSLEDVQGRGSTCMGIDALKMGSVDTRYWACRS